MANVFLIEIQSDKTDPDPIEEKIAISEEPSTSTTDYIIDTSEVTPDVIDTMTQVIVDQDSSIIIGAVDHIDADPNSQDPPPINKNPQGGLLIACSALLILGVLYAIYYWLMEVYKKKKKIADKNLEILKAQKDLAETKAKYDLLERRQIEDELHFKKNEVMTMALNLTEKNNFIALLREEIEEMSALANEPVLLKKLKDINLLISQKQSFQGERDSFRLKLDELNKDFFFKLNKKFPTLTKNEKQLCAYLRLNMPSKEIAILTNISTKSVEMGRYRLRKKLNLSQDEVITKFLQEI